MNKFDNIHFLSEHLKGLGWQNVDLNSSVPERGLDRVFISEYALVGIMFSSDLQNVFCHWADSQIALMKMVENDKLANLKDRYLVFLVDKIADSLREELRRVTDDTHECRKICIEVHGRALETVLPELPFVSNSLAENQSDQNIENDFDPALEATGLTSALLDDLGKRRASVILESWIEGKYSQETNTDAYTKH